MVIKASFLVSCSFVVKLDDEDKIISAYSGYFETMTGGPVETTMSGDASILNTVTQVLCGMIILCLVLLSTLYIWHRYSKTAAQGDEVISLRDSLRFVIVDSFIKFVKANLKLFCFCVSTVEHCAVVEMARIIIVI